MGQEIDESAILEQGSFEQGGFLLVQVSASASGVSGTVVVDMRRGDGTGGSLRAARATVDYGSHINAAHITMPVEASEGYIIYAETPAGSIPPQISVRKLGTA